VAFSPDGRTLAAVHDDRCLAVWDVPPGKPPALFLAGAAPLAVLLTLLARRRVRRLCRAGEARHPVSN
jgi:hypothetical protein